VLPFEIYSSGNSMAIKESLYKSLSGELNKEEAIQIIRQMLFFRAMLK